MKAYGYIVTKGLLAAIEAADTALKESQVILEKFYIPKDGTVTVELRGTEENVKKAVEAGSKRAEELGKLLEKAVISEMHEGVKSILNDYNQLVKVEKREKFITEVEKIKEIVRGSLPTAEGKIPLYDEIVKSPEFSELLLDDEIINAISEKVKRNEEDAIDYDSQEKISVQEEKKICSETDKIREIVKGGLPTSEGDIPIYDEVIKSPEFSELAMEDEALTEKVKRSETDGEAHKTQEKIIDEK